MFMLVEIFERFPLQNKEVNKSDLHSCRGLSLASQAKCLSSNKYFRGVLYVLTPLMFFSVVRLMRHKLPVFMF